MTLQFAREAIIIDCVPVLGTVTVEVAGQLDRYDGLWQLDLDVTAFEPETPVPGLLWATVATPCEAWLAQNRNRVEKRALGISVKG